MGGSWSTNKRRHDYIHHPQPPASTPPMILPQPSDYASSSSTTPPIHNYNLYPPNPNPPNYGYAAPSPAPPQPNPNYSLPHPPPPLPAYGLYTATAPVYHAAGGYYGATSMYNQCGYVGPPVVNGVGYAQPYYVNQYNGWGAYRPALPPPQPPHGFVMQQGAAHPKFVEHQNAKKVKNYVNVRKDSVKIQVDEQHPDQFLVSFEFDAEHDGSVTVYYFAKVEEDCKISPLFPEACTPVKVPFQKGSGQKFQQASGTGFDLGFFEMDDLAKPSPTEDVFPLVIAAETSVPSDGQLDEHMPVKSPHMQITQAVLIKKDSGFQVKVMKQILWIDGVRYELRDLFGIGTSSIAEGSNDDSDTDKECVICLTEPKNTAVLPCRHMCLCSECAKALRFQSDKCPICRQPIEEIMEIKIESNGK